VNILKEELQMKSILMNDLNRRPWDRNPGSLNKIAIPEWLTPIIQKHRQLMTPIWLTDHPVIKLVKPIHYYVVLK
jgi:hypothetical protein